MGLAESLIEMFNRGAMGSRRVRASLTPFTALFFLGLIALFTYLALLVDDALGFPALFSSQVGIAAGVPVVVIGFALMFWCIFSFLRVKGTPVPFNPPPKLVTSGPYGMVRNPMLTGVFIIMFGIGFLFTSISLVAFFTPLHILLMVWEVKTVEEPELVKRLGDEYVEYRKRVPMFIPRLKKERF